MISPLGIKTKKVINKKSETDITNQILDGLSKMRIGSFNRINNVPAYNAEKGYYQKPSKYSPKGVSDIIGCYRGRYVAIEVKTNYEYNRVMKFEKYLIANDFHVLTYTPKSKWQEHILRQMVFIGEKRFHGAIGFFTYSLTHTLEKLKELDSEKNN